jgi:hypothetical protein
MYRLFVLAGLLALAVIVSGAQVQAEDKDKKDKDTKKADKPKSIEEIMEKAHAGDDAFRAAVAKAVKEGDFKAAAAPMKAWGALAPHLGSFKPPQGDKKSWDKLTKQYAEQVKALAAAIGKKDQAKAKATLTKINLSCAGCHKIHKKEDE